MNKSLKHKLAFTMKNFGITIHEFDNLAHRASVAKWARLLNELRQDANTNPVAIELVWAKIKSL
jgi:hypothetical protein